MVVSAGGPTYGAQVETYEMFVRLRAIQFFNFRVAGTIQFVLREVHVGY